MNIISVDLPWNPDNRNRTALAVADLKGDIRVMLANHDDEMLFLIRENIERGSLILLDIGIEGCGELRDKKFRPVDIALARQGIWIQPISGDRNRGRSLKKRIQSSNPGKRVIVQEIYPYAVYKFLACLKKKGLLGCLNIGKFDALLDEGFRVYRPPKYKREKEKEKRLKNMEYLYSLLTDTDIGLNFRTPLNRPHTSSNLNQLGDEYDACLGAIVGIYYANNSSYACIAGDSKSGNILILADQWLREQLSADRGVLGGRSPS